VIIKQRDGRAILGQVIRIDHETASLRVMKCSILDVAGSRGASEPIYRKSMTMKGVISIPIENVVDWERSTESLNS
jgi:hypothetical protein